MVTLQQLFDIFKVSYNSPDGDYYPKRDIYVPYSTLESFIPYLPEKLYQKDTIYPIALKILVPLKLKILRVNNHKFKFYKDNTCYYEIENIEPACLFLSKDECLDYIMECSFLRCMDNVIPNMIEFHIKAAKINFTAYNVILRRVFNIFTKG